MIGQQLSHAAGRFVWQIYGTSIVLLSFCDSCHPLILHSERTLCVMVRRETWDNVAPSPKRGSKLTQPDNLSVCRKVIGPGRDVYLKTLRILVISLGAVVCERNNLLFRWRAALSPVQTWRSGMKSPKNLEIEIW